MRRPAVLSVGVAAAIVVLVALGIFVPWALRARTVVVSTPQPHSLFTVTPVPLAAGQQACVDQVALGPDTQVATFYVVSAKAAKGPPLRVTASAPGYRASTLVQGGYEPSGSISAALPRTPARSELGTLCIANAGRRLVSLSGTEEARTIGRTTTTVDGRQVASHVALSFEKAAPQSLLARLPQLLAHAATFVPLPVALLWILLAAVVVAVPVGAVGALYLAVRR